MKIDDIDESKSKYFQYRELAERLAYQIWLDKPRIIESRMKRYWAIRKLEIEAKEKEGK